MGLYCRDHSELKCRADCVNGHEDHCHILIMLPSTLSLAKLVQTVKANSSKWISETFPQLSNFEWQEGYSAFSVSTSMLGRTTAYVKNQETHHRTKDYHEEYIAFLKANNIEFDARYVLG